MKRSKVCEEFLEHNEVNCVTMINSEDEGSFTSGCDVCNSLATTTYSCNGYSPIHKKIFELGEVCGECLMYFYNGEDSEIEE